MTRFAATLLCGLLLAACIERVDVADLVFRCASDADCRAGRFCDPVARVCVASVPDYPDLAEPDPAAVEAVEPEPVPEPIDVATPDPVELVPEVADEGEPPCAEGQPCDDGDPCTLDDRCTNGRCVGGAPPLDDDCDGVDDDCDGLADDDYVPMALACGLGACAATGATSCEAGSVLLQCHPGEPSPETCNGVDDDCDGLADGADPDLPACDHDGDGWCAGPGPDPGPTLCPQGLGDCDDAHPSAHPGAIEACDVGLVDEDCDGWTNEDPREVASAAWPGATEAGWALAAGQAGWHPLVSESDAWLGTPDDVDVYRAPLVFETVGATVVQARVGAFDPGVLRWVCLYVTTPQGAPSVACSGAAAPAVAPDPAAVGCCRQGTDGGQVDVAVTVNLAGAQEATAIVMITAGGGACDAYGVALATAM